MGCTIFSFYRNALFDVWQLLAELGLPYVSAAVYRVSSRVRISCIWTFAPEIVRTKPPFLPFQHQDAAFKYKFRFAPLLKESVVVRTKTPSHQGPTPLLCSRLLCAFACTCAFPFAFTCACVSVHVHVHVHVCTCACSRPLCSGHLGVRVPRAAPRTAPRSATRTAPPAAPRQGAEAGPQTQGVTESLTAEERPTQTDTAALGRGVESKKL